jgi:predicted nucleic acid-binding protein
MLLVDTNVLLDVFENDQRWVAWSLSKLRAFAQLLQLSVDPVVYAEQAIGFSSAEDLDAALAALRIDVVLPPKDALFLAGRKFVEYRRRGGLKNNVLPDFFVGAHAAIRECAVLTRDSRRFRTYFPTVRLIAPETDS